MKIKTFIGGFDKNFSYLIWCEKTRIAAIIDPAVEITPILEYIESLDLITTKILITHTHQDHIFYLNHLRLNNFHYDTFQDSCLLRKHVYHKLSAFD